LAPKDRGMAIRERKGGSCGRATPKKSEAIASSEPTVLRRFG